MAFCSNCGTNVRDEAKYCQKCGAATDLEPSNREKQRQQEYSGKIYKCPNCGESLRSFSSTCTSCGCDIRGTEALNSVREFALKLEHAYKEQDRIDLVRTFPIPNTKEDIFEFVVLASTNIKGEIRTGVYNAWVAKIEQSYQKAQVVCSTDAIFLRIESIYKQTQSVIKKDKFFRGAKNAGNAMKRSVGLASLLFGLLGRNLPVVAGIFLYIWSILIDSAGGNSSMHELIGAVLLTISASILSRRNAPYLDFLIVGSSGILSFFLARFLENGAMLQLGGVLVLVIVVVNYFRKLGKKHNYEGE